MTRIEPDDRLLRSIPLDVLVTYLVANGWKRIEHANNKLLVFEGLDDDDAQPIKLILPRSTDYQDSYVRLAEAINLVAAIQEKSPSTLANELASSAVIIRQRRQLDTNRIKTEIAVLERSLERLQQDKAINSLLFQTNAQEWQLKYSELSPVSISEQTRLAHICFYSAIGAVISNVALNGIVAFQAGLPFWTGALLAVPLTSVFQGAISALFGLTEGGPSALSKIKKFILAPSFVLSIVGLTCLLLIRMGTNISSVIISLIFTVISIALLAIAGGLFTFWNILSWSERAEKQYVHLNEKESELLVERGRLTGELNSIYEGTQIYIDQPLNRSLEISHEVSS
jgi:hypothetical protein